MIRAALACILFLFAAVNVLAMPPAEELAERIAQCTESIQQLRLNYRLSSLPEHASQLATCMALIGIDRAGRRDFPAALDALDQARELSPQDPAILETHVRLLVAADRRIEAADILDDQADITARSPSLLILRGDISYREGNLNAAIADYRTALELSPGQAAWQEQLSRMEKEIGVERDMERDASIHFSLTFDAALPARLSDQILDVLEDAHNDLGIFFNRYPEDTVPVLIYRNEDFARVTNSPDWAGGLYDGKIRIPLGGMSTMTAELKALIYHEYTHVLVRLIGGNRIPTWLNEGLARMAEEEFVARPFPVLQAAAKKGEFLPADLLSISWGKLPAPVARLAYEQSHAFVRHLAREHGDYLVVSLLERISYHGDPDRAMIDLLGFDNVQAAMDVWKATL